MKAKHIAHDADEITLEVILSRPEARALERVLGKWLSGGHDDSGRHEKPAPKPEVEWRDPDPVRPFADVVDRYVREVAEATGFPMRHLVGALPVDSIEPGDRLRILRPSPSSAPAAHGFAPGTVVTATGKTKRTGAGLWHLVTTRHTVAQNLDADDWHRGRTAWVLPEHVEPAPASRVETSPPPKATFLPVRTEVEIVRHVSRPDLVTATGRIVSRSPGYADVRISTGPFDSIARTVTVPTAWLRPVPSPARPSWRIR